MRRMRSACCARAANGHAAILLNEIMNSRRWIWIAMRPSRRGHATEGQYHTWTCCAAGFQSGLMTAWGQFRQIGTVPRLTGCPLRSPKADMRTLASICPLRANRVLTRCSKLAPGFRQHFERRWLAVGASGQSHREYGALAGLASHSHIATHHACEFARKGKAEPRPAIAACGQRICLGEVLE
jgi:hypothetical protein